LGVVPGFLTLDMLRALNELDAVVTELAATLYQEAPLQHWEQQRLIARYTPDGGVGSHEYVYTLQDGSVEHGQSPASGAARAAVRELTRKHWDRSAALGQSRWYQLTLTLDRKGQYRTEFGYGDAYETGDIMRPSA
jgi:hypothetical protein